MRANIPSGLDGFEVRDVAAGTTTEGQLLVAAAHNGVTSSRILLSRDGLTWTLAETPNAFATLLNAVAYGDSGFVAIGTNKSPQAAPRVRLLGVVWYSVDGQSWDVVPPIELWGTVPVILEAIAGHGYVAAGFVYGEAPPRLLTWTSDDAISWQEHEIRPAQQDGGSLGLLSDSDGAVAIIAGIDPSAYAGLSTDAVSWSFEPLPLEYVEPTAIDISAEATVMTAYLAIADGPHESYVIVRDRDAATWRMIDWRSHLPVDIVGGFGRIGGVAVSPDAMLLLLWNGRVVLAPWPL